METQRKQGPFRAQTVLKVSYYNPIDLNYLCAKFYDDLKTHELDRCSIFGFGSILPRLGVLTLHAIVYRLILLQGAYVTYLTS